MWNARVFNKNLKGESPDTVLQLLTPLAKEFAINGWPEVRLAGSQAEVDPKADVSLLEAEILIVEIPIQQVKTDDILKDLCHSWILSEKRHVTRLRSSVPLYGSPLTQLGVLAPQDFAKLCQPLAALAETCQFAANKIVTTNKHWPGCMAESYQFETPRKVFEGAGYTSKMIERQGFGGGIGKVMSLSRRIVTRK